IGVHFDRSLDGFEDDATGIGPVLAVNDFATDALPPSLELLNGRCSKRITGGKHAGFPLRLELCCQFANRGGLASSVDAYEHDDGGLLRDFEGARLTVDGEDAYGLVAQCLPNFRLVAEFVALEPVAQSTENGLGRANPDIRGEQYFLDLLGDAGVDLLAADEKRLQSPEETFRFARLRQTLAKALHVHRAGRTIVRHFASARHGLRRRDGLGFLGRRS